MSQRDFHTMYRRVLTLGAVTLAFGTAGLLVGPATVGAATPSPTATAAVTKVLTNASNGTTTVVTKGWRVVVKLSSRDGYAWTEASVVNASPEVVLKKVSGHISRNGSSTTTFAVAGYGSATLVATGTATCTGTVCVPLSINWSANVESVVLDPPGPTG